MWHKKTLVVMREKGISQNDLAKKLHVTRGAIGHYLSGRREPGLKRLALLAEALEVDAGWLVFDSLKRTATLFDFRRMNNTTPPLGREKSRTFRRIDAVLVEQILPINLDEKHHVFEVIRDNYAPVCHAGEYLIVDTVSSAQQGNIVVLEQERGVIEIMRLEALQGKDTYVLSNITYQEDDKRIVMESDIAWMHPLVCVMRVPKR